MRPHVRLRLPSGEVAELGHGDVIGRLWNAALHLDDARISEAHALVSLRGGELKLLALRGRFAVDQQPRSEVTLVAGMEVLLARGFALRVEAVVLPDHVLAIEAEGFPRQHLVGVASLYARSDLSLVRRWAADADAWLWDTGAGWRLRSATGEIRELQAGTEVPLGAHVLRVVRTPLAGAGPERTRALGGVGRPLKLVTYFDTVHVHQDGREPLQLRGQGARILSELAAIEAPVGWEELARMLWPAPELVQHQRRKKWDVALARLRSKLKEGGVRPDLVRADGSGLFELFLYEGDTVEDRS